MGTLYALLAGIGEYPDKPLRGPRNDVRHAEVYLRGHADDAAVEILLDADATRAAIVHGLRDHLGRARSGDTALFWFAGHGSEIPVPPELAWLAPDGKAQTIVCADGDLLDREIAVLLDGVAAAGAHVVVVLDCCHADGVTRGDPALVTRSLPGRGRTVDAVVPELRTGNRDAAVPLASHVLLAACDSNQRAAEAPFRGVWRGVFSRALLDALTRLGPDAGYRALLGAARCEVENTLWAQHPTLRPTDGVLVDQPFLGGALRPATSGITASWVRGEWRIDVGACHGMVVGTADEPVELGVVGDPVRALRVVEVGADRSTVVPVGWRPEPAARYPVVLTRVPLPATTIAFGPVVDPDTATRIAAAVRTAGPGGTPSPHVRVVEPADRRQAPDLRLHVPGPDLVDVTTADDHVLIAGADVGGAGVPRLVADLEHIARWRRLKALANPTSALAGAVRIEVLTERGEPLLPDASGTLHVSYEGTTPPKVVVRLRNTCDRDLFCVLLDLTDRYRVHPRLLPGEWVRARHAAHAARGRAIALSLPADRPVVPGATVRDWFKLLVSPARFSVLPFHLPRLGEPAELPDRSGLAGVVDRLGLAALHGRDSGEGGPAADWTTAVVSIVTTVPSLP